MARNGSYREKRLSPRQAPGRSLLPLSPKRTQVRLKSLLYLVWLTPDPLRTHGRPTGQYRRLRLKRPSSIFCNMFIYSTLWMYDLAVTQFSRAFSTNPIDGGRQFDLRMYPSDQPI